MKKLLLFLFLCYSGLLPAQNDRVNDYNYINWVESFNTIRLNKQWSLHAEYQWRRDQGLKYWQQSLLRLGVNNQTILQRNNGWVLNSFLYL